MAIGSLIKQQRKKLDGGQKEQGGEIQDEDVIFQQLTLLESLRVFEHEIVADVEYLRKYYAGGYRLHNNGWTMSSEVLMSAGLITWTSKILLPSAELAAWSFLVGAEGERFGFCNHTLSARKGDRSLHKTAEEAEI